LKANTFTARNAGGHRDTDTVLASSGQTTDFASIANDWVTAATATCGKAEAASLRSVTKRIVQQLGSLRADDVDSDAVAEYVRSLVDAGLKPKNHLRVLRRILGHAQSSGFLAGDPLTRITASDSATGVQATQKGALPRARNRQSRKKTRQNSAVPSNLLELPTDRTWGHCQNLTQTQGKSPASPNPTTQAQITSRPKGDPRLKPKGNRTTQVPLPNVWRYFRLGDPIFRTSEGDDAAVGLGRSEGQD